MSYSTDVFALISFDLLSDLYLTLIVILMVFQEKGEVVVVMRITITLVLTNSNEQILSLAVGQTLPYGFYLR